jgi:hypothetical protein
MRRLKILGIVTGLLFVSMVTQSASLEPSIPTIQFSFSEASFKSIIAQWQSAGVARFKTHFAFDFPFLLSYGAFGYALAAHTTLPQALPPIVRLPFTSALPVAAVMDASENLLHLYFVHAATVMFTELYFVAGVVATCKWLLITTFLIAVLYAYARVGILSHSKVRSKPIQH